MTATRTLFERDGDLMPSTISPRAGIGDSRRRYALPNAHSPLWVVAEAGAAAVLSILALLMIGRAIGPEAAGIGALAVAAYLVMDMFGASLFSDALIQRPELTARHADSAFTVAGLVGAAAGVLLALVGPSVVGGDRIAAMPYLLVALALVLPISAVSSVMAGLLMRQQRYRLLSTRYLVSQPLALLAGLAAAQAGWGPWAMVVLQATVTLCHFGLMMAFGGLRLRLRADTHALRELLPVAGPQSAATIVELSRYRIFLLALGSLMAEAMVARAHFAFRIMDAALVPVWQVTIRLSTPRLSALQHDRRAMADAYGDLAQLQAMLALPITLGVALTVPDAVQYLLGADWNGTAEAAQLVGFATAVFFAFGTYTSLFVALGRPTVNLVIGSAWFALQLVGLVIIQPTTPLDAAYAFALPPLILVPVIVTLVLRALGRSPLWLARRVAPAAFATLAMVIAVLAIDGIVTLSPLPHLAVAALVGATVFTMTAWLALGCRLPEALRAMPAIATGPAAS